MRQKGSGGQRHLKEEAKVSKSGTEEMGGEREGTEHANLAFSEAGEGMKLKVVFELRGINRCKNEQNNQLTCVAINQLLRWHIDSQSA